jgi:hypothetical protein
MPRVGLLIVLLYLSGLADAAPSAATAGGSGLVLLLASDAPVYSAGTPVQFTLAVDNPGQASVTVAFPSAQLYEIVVFTDQRETWRWSADRAFADMELERAFPPGLTLLGREVWESRDPTGAPLSPGTYQAVASLATAAPQPRGNGVAINLTAP